MSNIKLRTLRYRVIIGDPELPQDTWAVHEVQSIGRDMTRAETIFARKKWGKPMDHPIRYQDLVAWCALVRAERIDMSWDEFEQTYIECAAVDDDEAGDEGEDGYARPTRPGPDPGY